MAGYPHITLPMGQVAGLPVNLSLAGDLVVATPALPATGGYQVGYANTAAGAALAANDSNPFWSALGDLLVTGQTNTNVNDLVVVVAYP